MSDPTQPPAKPEAKVEKRVFKALSRVHLDGVEKQAGAQIDVDVATHRQLVAAGAVEGEWAEAKVARTKE